MLLLALLGLLCAGVVNGVVVPLNATKASAAILASACTTQGKRNVCYPIQYDGGVHYISCGAKPTVQRCATGTLFDYVKRKCVPKKSAQVCPFYYAPATGGPALGIPLGVFGAAGNATISLPKKESFTILCPVNGHALGGMVFNVDVSCPAPADRYPYTFSIDWDEILTNDMAYPKRHADLQAYCGDEIFLAWDEPIHLVQIFNTSAAAKSLWKGMSVNPYPPQPVYECPTWEAAPGPPGNYIPRPGEIELIPFGTGPQNYTWNATVPETFFFVCVLENHCRLGMLFQVEVLPAPANYTPVMYNIDWILTNDPFPNMSIYVGDSMFIGWSSPAAAHMLWKSNQTFPKL